MMGGHVILIIERGKETQRGARRFTLPCAR
jgi:hypothetical protein